MSESTSLSRKIEVPAAARRIGLVGCGRWGALILRDLVALGCSVTVATRHEESRRRATAGGAAVVGEIEQLPDDLAGYVVATPTATHDDVVERLLGRQRPVFVEKPLTANPAIARHIAERGKGRVFVMDKWRYHPGIEALGQLARSGELGSPRKLVMNRLQWGYDHDDVDAIWTLLPHDLSILQEILGRIPPPLAAVAERDEGGAIAGLSAFLRDGNGAVDVQCEVSIRRPRFLRSVDLICHDGVATLDDPYADHIKILRDDGDGTTHLPPAERRPVLVDMPLLRELAAFVGFCGGGPAPKSTAADGAVVVETIIALRWLAGIAD